MDKVLELFNKDPFWFVVVTIFLVGFAISTIKDAWKE